MSTPTIWKEIPGCEGAYAVSDDGRVQSLERWVIGGKGKRQHVPTRILKPARDSDGYCVVSIKFNNKTNRLMKVHRLVLLVFKGEDSRICCHKDGNPENNHLSNLRYGTPLDNANDRTLHGRKVGALGEANGVAKLTEDAVRRIRSLLDEGFSHQKVADLFGVCNESIRKIARGLTWKHV